MDSSVPSSASIVQHWTPAWPHHQNQHTQPSYEEHQSNHQQPTTITVPADLAAIYNQALQMYGPGPHGGGLNVTVNSSAPNGRRRVRDVRDVRDYPQHRSNAHNYRARRHEDEADDYDDRRYDRRPARHFPGPPPPPPPPPKRRRTVVWNRNPTTSSRNMHWEHPDVAERRQRRETEAAKDQEKADQTQGAFAVAFAFTKIRREYWIRRLAELLQPKNDADCRHAKSLMTRVLLYFDEDHKEPQADVVLALLEYLESRSDIVRAEILERDSASDLQSDVRTFMRNYDSAHDSALESGRIRVPLVSTSTSSNTATTVAASATTEVTAEENATAKEGKSDAESDSDSSDREESSAQHQEHDNDRASDSEREDD